MVKSIYMRLQRRCVQCFDVKILIAVQYAEMTISNKLSIG